MSERVLPMFSSRSFIVSGLESPLDSKEIKPVNPKGNKS